MMNTYTFFDDEGEVIAQVEADNHDHAVALSIPDVDEQTPFKSDACENMFPWLGI